MGMKMEKVKYFRREAGKNSKGKKLWERTLMSLRNWGGLEKAKTTFSKRMRYKSVCMGEWDPATLIYVDLVWVVVSFHLHSLQQLCNAFCHGTPVVFWAWFLAGIHNVHKSPSVFCRQLTDVHRKSCHVGFTHTHHCLTKGNDKSKQDGSHRSVTW